MTQIFLLTDGTNNVLYFPDPGNWNPVNTVECLGSGSYGANGLATGTAAGGGGGGAYAKGTNIVPTAWPAPYAVRQSVASPSGYMTCFNTSNYSTVTSVPGTVVAGEGRAAFGPNNGGSGGAYFFPSGFAGGAGGNAPAGSGGP